MKKQISLLFFLCSLITFSQNNEILVTYDVFYNTKKPRLKEAYLSINNREWSKYIELPEFKLLGDEKENEGEEVLNVNYSPSGILRVVDINKKQNKLSSIETIVFDKTVYKVNEVIPIMKWNITYNDEKKIGNYICNKATVNFRGRNYIAWYSLNIPALSGPWKFTGAPGLILEIYDETLTYRWLVKKIEKKNALFDDLNKKVSYDVEIDLITFIDKKFKKENKKDTKSKMEAKLPRGVTIEFNLSNVRQGKELKFEWEEETKEN